MHVARPSQVHLSMTCKAVTLFETCAITLEEIAGIAHLAFAQVMHLMTRV